ncbi:hypothetical protein J19TS2_59090 [Cohnella xylanilytica]|uniref:hypothetical protein n=1 Tax=Cohnella xylanilytica TaxID=557555 RepID=UPI001B13D7D5|nr:hypothetical protein [Cohnella xylanilytica]GIO16354.1 hypothetical protein J19TS2_59090 [Cohnella xylanilytica]
MHLSSMTAARAVGAFVLAASLAACSSAGHGGTSADPSSAAGIVRSSPPPPSSATPAASPMTAPSSSGTAVPDHGKPGVDAAGAEPGGKEEDAGDDDAPFDSEHPTLAGIGLGMSGEAVADKLGAPLQQYELPEGDGSVRIQEYEGISVGFAPSGSVVFVEVASPSASTGLEGIRIGGGGERAAEGLGVPFTSESRVLSKSVAGGMVKIDLDPSTQNVLSVKLIGETG